MVLNYSHNSHKVCWCKISNISMFLVCSQNREGDKQWDCFEFFFLIWIRLEVLHAVSIGLINSQSHKHHRESTNPLFPHFLPLFLFTFQDSLLPHPMYSTWIDAFAAVTYTPPLLSKKWLEKMNIFLWSMILYIYIYNRNEMQYILCFLLFNL